MLVRLFQEKKLQLSIYDKEMLVVVYAVVHHWKPYLMGKPFKIITDHKCLDPVSTIYGMELCVIKLWVPFP